MSFSSTKPPLVMLVEDEPMIALALEEEFIHSMFSVSGPFRSCAAAMSALDWSCLTWPCSTPSWKMGRATISRSN